MNSPWSIATTSSTIVRTTNIQRDGWLLGSHQIIGVGSACDVEQCADACAWLEHFEQLTFEYTASPTTCSGSPGVIGDYLPPLSRHSSDEGGWSLSEASAYLARLWVEI